MSEKTEKPTEHKIREARKEGQVAKSRDATQLVLLAGLFGYSSIAVSNILAAVNSLLQGPSVWMLQPFHAVIGHLLARAAVAVAAVSLPFVLIVLVLGTTAELFQSGFLLSVKAILPKAERLDPVKRFIELFSLNSLIELLKNILKVLALLVVVYYVLASSLGSLVLSAGVGMEAVRALWGKLLGSIVLHSLLCLSAFAVLDLAWQRFRYTKSLMMSIDEVRREHKQLEGDPHMKGHRRGLSREIALGQMVERTRTANVVLTNPTKLAIALRYERGTTPLPIVVSKGEGGVARAIRKVALEEGIPVMENVPLARALMDKGDIDRYIPAELIEPVAQVFRALRELAQDAYRTDGHD